MIERLGLLPAILVVAITSSAAGQATRPMKVDDLIGAIRVGDPQLSSDGRTVAFVRTTTDVATGRRNSDIWIVPADGSSQPRAWIESPRSDDTPRFLPDGRVVFISARGGTPQVYLADSSGKDVRVLTKVGAGVQAPLVVSRDGRTVAYVADVAPSCADEACNARERDSIEKDPVKVHRLTRLPFRHWSDWWEAQRHHVYVTDVATGETRDVTPGDFDSPPHFYEDGAIAFSSDGRELAFVSKREAKDSEMWSTNHDVFVVPLTGGGARRMTPTNRGADMQPAFTPDGKWMLVRSQRRAGFEADRWYLDRYDRSTGAKQVVFAAPDLSVDDFHLSPDGSTIWFTATRNASVNLYTVPTAGGTPKLVVQGGAVGAFAAGPSMAVYAKSSLVSPAELFSVDAQGREHQLTRENASWLANVALQPPKSLTVRGAAGASVQYWLIEPPHFDPAKKYPVVFLIHGGPQSDWADAWSYRWNPSLWAAQGWIVVAPNPRGSTGFGQKFVDEISQDWCGKPMTDLDAVFSAVSKTPSADASRMAIAGASYGGYAVDWIIGHDNRFKAAVSHDGVFNLESMALATEAGRLSVIDAVDQLTEDQVADEVAACKAELEAVGGQGRGRSRPV